MTREEHGEEDRLKREEVQTRNTADNMAYTAENMLKDNADKIPRRPEERDRG